MAKKKLEEPKEKIEEVTEAPKKYFVTDSEKADRTFDLGGAGIVQLSAGASQTEVTKEQSEALKQYGYLEIKVG